MLSFCPAIAFAPASYVRSYITFDNATNAERSMRYQLSPFRLDKYRPLVGLLQPSTP